MEKEEEKGDRGTHAGTGTKKEKEYKHRVHREHRDRKDRFFTKTIRNQRDVILSSSLVSYIFG